MGKINRQQVYDKFNGKCAYTGLPLDDKCQVDHSKSKYRHLTDKCEGDVNHIDNLLPAIRRVNHYKRSLTVEQFRNYMLKFHLRLRKLPKTTSSEKNKKRIEYMNDIANMFGLTIDKPFNGIFYFETL